MMLFVGFLGIGWLVMGSRKSDIPPNFDMLTVEEQDIVLERSCYYALKNSHGHSPSSNLLKSRRKIR